MGLNAPFSHKLLLGNDSVFIAGSRLVNSTKFKAPGQNRRLSPCLTGLWTSSSTSEAFCPQVCWLKSKRPAISLSCIPLSWPIELRRANLSGIAFLIFTCPPHQPHGCPTYAWAKVRQRRCKGGAKEAKREGNGCKPGLHGIVDLIESTVNRRRPDGKPPDSCRCPCPCKVLYRLRLSSVPLKPAHCDS